MSLGIISQAVGLFAVTNIDDIVLLALFFAQSGGPWRIVAGQYLGFAGTLVVAVAAAFGTSFLPDSVIPWLGLLPLALGVRAGFQAWRRRGDDEQEPGVRPGGPGILEVAAITFANGGDNLGVYVPVFAGGARVTVYVVVFVILVAVWLAAGRYLATRPVIAGALSRWGHIVLPVVLIGIGLVILSGAW